MHQNGHLKWHFIAVFSERGSFFFFERFICYFVAVAHTHAPAGHHSPAAQPNAQPDQTDINGPAVRAAHTHHIMSNVQSHDLQSAFRSSISRQVVARPAPRPIHLPGRFRKTTTEIDGHLFLKTITCRGE